MTDIKHVQRKNILADPVAQFTKSCPDAVDEQITALTRLQQQYVELEKQHKDKENQCKKISRQIGEAKRNDQPVDKLMQTIQEQSTKINNLKIQLNNISDNILSYFELENVSDSLVEQLPALPAGRVHTDQSVSSSQISIELLSADKNEAWNYYVESNPAASIYHRAEWKDLIHNVFGHDGYYFYAHHNGEITGVLPLVRLKSWLFGDFMVSMPYFNSGGAIANNLSIEQKLMQAANNHAENLDIEHIEYRDDIVREGLPVRTEKVNMILSLPDTHQKLWNTFTSKLRSQIRRPQREKTQVTFGGKECLDDFYTVFARNMRDLGTPVYGKSFFNKILQKFAEHSKIVVVRMEEKPVAAAFLLGYNNTLEIPWASTIKDVNHLSMNMLLYWEVLKFAIENQYRYFDFGRSSKASGTFRFKQQWGAKPKQLYWHYWLSGNAELPELNPNNPKFALAINIWKRLPIKITKLLGPIIVRNLP
jgi:FemAB-related protein (PEP-CTERM system-associated)